MSLLETELKSLFDSISSPSAVMTSISVEPTEVVMSRSNSTTSRPLRSSWSADFSSFFTPRKFPPVSASVTARSSSLTPFVRWNWDTYSANSSSSSLTISPSRYSLSNYIGSLQLLPDCRNCISYPSSKERCVMENTPAPSEVYDMLGISSPR